MKRATWPEIFAGPGKRAGDMAATLDQLKGLDISGDHMEEIRCYLTGQSQGSGHFPVNRYHIRDKHGTSRTVYNAKINIHREHAEPIYLGV